MDGIDLIFNHCADRPRGKSAYFSKASAVEFIFHHRLTSRSFECYIKVIECDFFAAVYPPGSRKWFEGSTVAEIAYGNSHDMVSHLSSQRSKNGQRAKTICGNCIKVPCQVFVPASYAETYISSL